MQLLVIGCVLLRADSAQVRWLSLQLQLSLAYRLQHGRINSYYFSLGTRLTFGIVVLGVSTVVYNFTLLKILDIFFIYII